MELGIIGLGRMGAAIAGRLIDHGHSCVVYDVNPDAVARVRDQGATAATSLKDLVGALRPPRAIWIMLPAAIVGETVDALTPDLDAGDIVIDGGNSSYRDDIARAEALAPRGIAYLDIGTSGGVFGRDRGFCLMIGGPDDAVAHLDPIFAALAPGRDAAPRTPGATGTAEQGYLHCGPSGAGHFVKMVHNGIEYGIMAAYAEGLNILRHANAGSDARAADAETAPFPDAPFYRYDLDTAAVAEVWRRGSVISSWLLDLTAAALTDDPGLEAFNGAVSDSGEGRWTIQAAVDTGTPAPVLAAALFQRFSSRGESDFADRVLSAMRSRFGGHDERAR